MGGFLGLSNGELATLARSQRIDELRRDYEEPQGALLKETRELILQKCVPNRQLQVRAIFERQPFGELEQLITQKLLDVVQPVARSELDNQTWLQEVAQLSDKSHEQMRVFILEFLDTDIFNISNEDCVSFLEPLIVRWDIDLSNFDIEITLNERLAAGKSKKFAFVEKEFVGPHEREPGLDDFLKDTTLSDNLTEEELDFLNRLRFKNKRPNRLFYYRAVQNFRDPLHFLAEEG
jgi:hypothetical protein